MKLGYIGFDQYGQKYTIKNHPRKELLEELYATHAEKMYRDTKDGHTRHVGYIIKGLWIEIFEVHQWKEATK